MDQDALRQSGGNVSLLPGNPGAGDVEKTPKNHEAARWEQIARILICFIGIHSSFLGILMLAMPRLMLQVFGFPGDLPVFFPSQIGVFLLIFGLCYLYALVEPAFVNVIFVSKSLAVAFLLAHLLLLAAPPLIWAAAAGDAGMLFLAIVSASRSPRYREALFLRALRKRPPRA